MARAPYGRGCDGCRKQKKKCDLTKPSCSRCVRSRIQCIGAGQFRYKFVNETLSDDSRQDFEKALSNRSCQTVMLFVPTNEVTEVSQKLVSMLQVKDARFDISIYGDFVNQIPQRLGCNKALDAAVSAFTTTMSYVYSSTHSSEMYTSYGNASRATRLLLSDPVEAKTPDTLCAIYLLMVCQGWVNKQDDSSPNHAKALSYLLNEADVKSWHGTFEKNVAETLTFITLKKVLESFSHSSIQVDPTILSSSNISGPNEDETYFDSLQVQNLAKLSKLLHHPYEDLIETQTMYNQLWMERIKMHQLLINLPNSSSSDNVRSTEVRVQMSFALILSFTLLFNSVLRSFESTFTLELLTECASLVDDAVRLAETATQYRPLGSSSMPLCLVVALAASYHDRSRNAEIETLLELYQQDSNTTNWLEYAQSLSEQLQNPATSSIVPKPHGALGSPAFLTVDWNELGRIAI
ncbi:hypothetical protein BT63DRAFT_444112 [Microthyrium microscopicum]|uniref:Zn(2)-C6 fungal-type domain-containing protein n=1 Tax=Microthyrium microscopicum TaxID=703497 RepID=A0A6A6TZU1_9PEZI|nr:hypothetical protein BT63DRAFT_444112 [Microthyrium microscopicum]